MVMLAEREEVGALFDRVLDSREVTAAYQPLVHLDSGEVVGFEALARGPEGPLRSPGALFAAAGRAGRVGELDWVCRAAAARGALASGLDPTISWFVNIEPAALGAPCPTDLNAEIDSARSLRVVTELTEREIDRDPARLLQATAHARRSHWGVALDDVGALPHSLALLPFVQPDVVKLDMSLLRSLGRADTAAVANAVRAYAEETGATILAEGVESEADARSARVLGASYGQGWLFGRPGPLPERVAPPAHPFAFDQIVDPDAGRTPFEIAAGARPVGQATKALLLPMSLHLEHQALVGGESLVLLSSFQEARHFTPGTAARYAGLAERNVLSVTMAAELVDTTGRRGAGGESPTGATGATGGANQGDGGSSPGGEAGSALRSVELAGDDPLVAEWNVVVVGPHFAGALIGRDCGDRGADQDRRFDYVLTHDRDLVVRAARSMMRRITEP